MSLFKLVEDHTDKNAYYHDYYFIDKYLTRDAIVQFRNSNGSVNDALDSASHIIADLMIK